jgi:AbrB family looped-hinge helix DNA binding protein
MSEVKLMKVSSKGQVVIPSSIRKEVGIETGDQLSIYTDGNTIFIKKIDKEEILREFRELASYFRQEAKKKGYTPDDVMRWVEEMRYGDKGDDG